jgi:preprotein translocase subunit SecD
MSVNPPKSGPSVAVIIAIASAVLLVLVGVIIALTVSLLSAQNSVKPDRDESDDDEDPATSEVVLDATWADGTAPEGDELDTVQDIITTRLEDAGIVSSGFYLESDQIHVTFDDNVNQKTLDNAAELLDVTFTADFRQVLDVGMCTSDNDYTDYGPDEEVVFCDQEGETAIAMAPSEISGETIIGATTFERDDGTWGVTIIFNPTGSAALATLTGRLASLEGVTNRLGITLGGVVIESPSVSEAIMNGEVSITGTFDEEAANALATQLRFAAKGLELSVDDTVFVK